jgi:hypothetical protein
MWKLDKKTMRYNRAGTTVKSQDGIELSTICRQLKMKAQDGKMRETDVATPDQESIGML